MKQILRYAFIFLVSFISGDYAMATSHSSSSNQWIAFMDPSHEFEVDFPHEPVHMQFQLFPEDSLEGQLDVYTVSLNEGVLMVSVITPRSIQELKNNELLGKKFNQFFYSCFARRLFYQPQMFKKNAVFKITPSTYDGYPSSLFSISYWDENQEKHILSGLIVLKEHHLYTLFYISPDHYKDLALFQHFIQSFHLKLEKNQSSD